MMTWDAYLTYKLVATVGGVVITAVFSWLVIVSDARYCKHCSRRKQWRWKKPHQLATRSYCPYHDEWENFT